MKATVKTLKNGYYGGILDALRGGTAEDVATAIGKTPWGTGGGLVQRTIADTPTIKGVKGSLPMGPAGGGGGPRTRQVTTTTTGDPAAESQAVMDYFSNRQMPGALMALAYGLRQARDTTSTQTRTVKVKGQQQRQPMGGGRIGASAGDLKELFYNGPGGVNVKNGQREPIGFVSGHTDHVHVAGATRAETMRAARIAQRMGLTVREFEPFDKVDPVHVANSYHYRKSGAADVSGPAPLMRKYDRKIARKFGA